MLRGEYEDPVEVRTGKDELGAMEGVWGNVGEGCVGQEGASGVGVMGNGQECVWTPWV
jgi:hypothetical protein